MESNFRYYCSYLQTLYNIQTKKLHSESLFKALLMSIPVVSKQEIEEAFVMYAEPDTNKMKKQSFTEVLRALGPLCGYPTKTDVKKYEDTLADSIDQATFVDIMSKRYSTNQANPKDVENPLKSLDKDNSGKILGSELRLVLTTLADKMSLGDYGKMWEYTGIPDPGDGLVDYNDLYQKIQKCLQ